MGINVPIPDYEDHSTKRCCRVFFTTRVLLILILIIVIFWPKCEMVMYCIAQGDMFLTFLCLDIYAGNQLRGILLQVASY